MWINLGLVVYCHALLTKADKQFSKAEGEFTEGKPDKAIARFAISWLNAQVALRFINLEKL